MLDQIIDQFQHVVGGEPPAAFGFITAEQRRIGACKNEKWHGAAPIAHVVCGIIVKPKERAADRTDRGGGFECAFHGGANARHVDLGCWALRLPIARCRRFDRGLQQLEDDRADNNASDAIPALGRDQQQKAEA
jgi:hypothetical protein